MNLHEYQAKHLFRLYNIPVPNSEVVRNHEEALEAITRLNTNRYVVKAQVHAGGRGKAGGVRLVSDKEELVATVKELIGKRLVTYQTDAKGQPINRVLIEEPCDISKELYLGRSEE